MSLGTLFGAAALTSFGLGLLMLALGGLAALRCLIGLAERRQRQRAKDELGDLAADLGRGGI